jgi:hypothetical protein
MQLPAPLAVFAPQSRSDGSAKPRAVARSRTDIIKRLHQHRGIAHGHQWACGITQSCILPMIRILAQGLAQQTQQRATMLQSRAYVVNAPV